MKKFILIIFSTTIIFTCSKKEKPYLISKDSIGNLTKTSMIKDLNQIFKNDSIRKEISGDSFAGKPNNIMILDNKGNELLEITPFENLDENSKIKEIKIIHPKFKTEKGINSKSVFKDIILNYEISKIDNSINNLIVSVNSLNIWFTIDKKQLSAELRFKPLSFEYNKLHIPDNAKINNLYLHWIN